uniref:Uncharacterized protein n=1 Tax=Trichogramma kaykai TaxID=54128 RepID=A0ABD2XR97_9HYME
MFRMTVFFSRASICISHKELSSKKRAAAPSTRLGGRFPICVVGCIIFIAYLSLYVSLVLYIDKILHLNKCQRR